MGVGGSIPFIAEFLDAFPEASVLVTGVEDPDTRAHGANEGLHLAEFERVVLAEALLLAEARRRLTSAGHGVQEALRQHGPHVHGRDVGLGEQSVEHRLEVLVADEGVVLVVHRPVGAVGPQHPRPAPQLARAATARRTPGSARRARTPARPRATATAASNGANEMRAIGSPAVREPQAAAQRLAARRSRRTA